MPYAWQECDTRRDRCGRPRTRGKTLNPERIPRRSASARRTLRATPGKGVGRGTTSRRDDPGGARNNEECDSGRGKLQRNAPLNIVEENRIVSRTHSAAGLHRQRRPQETLRPFGASRCMRWSRRPDARRVPAACRTVQRPANFLFNPTTDLEALAGRKLRPSFAKARKCVGRSFSAEARLRREGCLAPAESRKEPWK